MINFRDIGGIKRKLSTSWLKKHSWLRYSVSKDVLYCYCCVLFGTEGTRDKSFVTSPVSDWSNVYNYIKRHERLDSHSHNEQSALHFVDVKDSKKEPVTSLLSSMHKEDIERNRHIINQIIEVLILCGRQNISIRGHTPDRSNFMAILRHTAKQDEILKFHLENTLTKLKFKYTSPDIQSEIINICCEIVRKRIVQSCNKAEFFALIGDEATDVSTQEQVSVCVRFVDNIDGKCALREEFLWFVRAAETTGETLVDLFISTLEQYGISIENMRTQGYDGAANMSGIHRGVQARIKEIDPTANYVHCKAHVLNLAIVHASQDASVRTMMATIQEMAFSFHYSAKKLGKLQDELDKNQNVKDKLDGKTKVQTLCETRWFSRTDALTNFKSAFPVIVSSLEYLQSKGDDKSGVQLSAILRFDFILPLVIVNHILQAVVPLTAMLQCVSCDLLETLIRVFEKEILCMTKPLN
jgi:hypothetical protein